MSHVASKTSDATYVGLTALWALVVDAQKVRITSRSFMSTLECVPQSKVAVRSSNVLPVLYDVRTQQRNKENLLCYHAVSNIIQLLTED